MRAHLSRVVAFVAVGVAIATAVGISAPRSRTATRERDRVIRVMRGGTVRTDAADALHHDADTTERMLLATAAPVDPADGSLTGRSTPPGGAAVPATAPTVAPPGDGTLRPDTHPSHPLPTRLRPLRSGRAPPPHN
jgi:hypothetical protein